MSNIKDEHVLVLHCPWGESPEDLYLDGKEWEAEQAWRKQKEDEFRKNMVKFLAGTHRSKP